MGMVHIVEGPVGAGKTTFANQLGRQYKTPPLVMDDWMVRLFSADRPQDNIWPWYAERKKRCIDQIWNVAVGLLDNDNHAIVELGLLRSQDRRAFCRRMEQAGFAYRLYILDAPTEDRWQRVQQRNLDKGETFSMEVSEEVFVMASQLWEPPDGEECAEYAVEFVSANEMTVP